MGETASNRERPAETVLVVDDDPALVGLVGALLADAGYSVRSAETVADTQVALAAGGVDLVLLDIGLPDGSGIDLTRRLRADPRTADIAIICITATDDVDRRIASLEAGADDFIGKPFSGAELATRVRVHLARRRAQRDLRAGIEHVRRVESAKDDLVHMMVHDMGNVLAGAMGYLELAAASRDDPEELERDLKSARDCVRTLQRMFADVLDLRRLEEGRMPIERHAFDLGAAIREATEALLGLAVARRKRLRVEDIPSDLPRIEADRSLVTRVLVNLVMNALKYSGKGGEVTVGAARAGADRVAVFVDDEGPGIAPEVRARLFEKFATGASAEQAAASGERGRGLGLAFCKAAVDAHGGAIRVFDRQPRGTRFWVEWPVAPASGDGTAAPPGPRVCASSA